MISWIFDWILFPGDQYANTPPSNSQIYHIIYRYNVSDYLYMIIYYYYYYLNVIIPYVIIYCHILVSNYIRIVQRWGTHDFISAVCESLHTAILQMCSFHVGEKICSLWNLESAGQSSFNLARIVSERCPEWLRVEVNNDFLPRYDVWFRDGTEHCWSQIKKVWTEESQCHCPSLILSSWLLFQLSRRGV